MDRTEDDLLFQDDDESVTESDSQDDDECTGYLKIIQEQYDKLYGDSDDGALFKFIIFS